MYLAPIGPRPELTSQLQASIQTYYTSPAPTTLSAWRRFAPHSLISRSCRLLPALSVGLLSPKPGRAGSSLIDPGNPVIQGNRPKTPQIVRRRERPCASDDPKYPTGLRQPFTRGLSAHVALFASNEGRPDTAGIWGGVGTNPYTAERHSQDK